MAKDYINKVKVKDIVYELQDKEHREDKAIHVPEALETDLNKVLTVGNDGTPVWKEQSETELNPATKTTLGGIKVGDNLVIAEDGKLDAIAYDDTEIRGEIADLSTSKEDISNKVQEITAASTETQYPSAKAVYEALKDNSDIFWCEYEVTTYEEAKAAFDSGKQLLTRRGPRIYPLVNGLSDCFWFTCCEGTKVINISLTEDVGWQEEGFYRFENIDNKTSTISSSSTDTQYPSAKAVYDAIQASDKIFIATYGTTTYGQVKTAVDANKIVILKEIISGPVGNTVLTYNFVRCDTMGASFICSAVNDTSDITIATIYNTTNIWSKNTFKYETTANKVTSIDDSSTDVQYPSAKAVYDAIKSSTPTRTNLISKNGFAFESLQELQQYTGEFNDDDIAFVTGIDDDGYTYYDIYRGKHTEAPTVTDLTDTTWKFKDFTSNIIPKCDKLTATLSLSPNHVEPINITSIYDDSTMIMFSGNDYRSSYPRWIKSSTAFYWYDESGKQQFTYFPGTNKEITIHFISGTDLTNATLINWVMSCAILQTTSWTKLYRVYTDKEVRDDLTEAEQSISDLSDRVSGVEEDITNIGTQISEVNTHLGQHDSQISTLDTRITAAETDIQSKQDTLTPGENITIENNIISATDTVYDDTEIKNRVSAIENSVGAVNGIAQLDSTGKVPSTQLPSFVDDVIEGYYFEGKFYQEIEHTTEIPGEKGKIYVDLHTDKTYRWSGSQFVEISPTGGVIDDTQTSLITTWSSQKINTEIENKAPFTAQDEEPADEIRFWIDTDDNTDDGATLEELLEILEGLADPVMYDENTAFQSHNNNEIYIF